MDDVNIPELLSTWKGNLVRNTSNAFSEMTPQGYIRLVIIVGTYLLIRPWLLKAGARYQERMHEKESAELVEAEVHPNELRGGKGKFAIPGIDPDSDEEGEARAGDWGRAARVRQRKFIRAAMEKEEARRQDEQEAESDKEIEQFLVD